MEKILEKLKQDRLLWIIVTIIFLLGIFVRLNQFSQVSYWNDDMTTIPTGLLWFYPHSFYPGLAGQGEPALGNFFIGLGCMLSGEDFSRVQEIKPMFYPGREILLGQQLVNAQPYCHVPMYIFGLLFFIVISLLALSLLNKYSATYVIAFFAFSPTVLQYSRWIHVEIILYFFIALGVFLAWKAYNKPKGSMSEVIYFSSAFASFALSLTVKLPAGLYLLFGIFMILEKYKEETLSLLGKFLRKANINIIKEKTASYKSFLVMAIASILSYLIFLLPPLGFRLGNLFAVINKYQSVNPERTGIMLNTDIAKSMFNFLIEINIIDMLVFASSLFIFYRLLKKKKDTGERFITYLFVMFLITLIFTNITVYVRVFLSFAFGLVFLSSLIFSEREYSMFSLLKIHKKRFVFLILILIYVAYSASLAIANSPYFTTSKNPALCIFDKERCNDAKELSGFEARETAEFLGRIMKDDETFLGMEGILFYYIRQEQGLLNFIFEENFKRQFGRGPTINEKIGLFKPNNRNVRYLLISPYRDDIDKDLIAVRQRYLPNYKIALNGNEVLWIYDLKNWQSPKP